MLFSRAFQIARVQYLVHILLKLVGGLLALGKANLQLVEGYPKCSQDFNTIENAWDILKKRLDQTIPVELESGDNFVTRLENAVKWVNRNRKDQLWYLPMNQKERAEECLAQEPPGGRTSW